MIRRDPHESEPVYKSLARSIREAIESGTVPPGSQMPAARQLAEQQGTSTATVLRAYAYLTSLGYLETLPKEGTFVAFPMSSKTSGTESRPPAEVRTTKWSEYAQRLITASSEQVGWHGDFSAAVPAGNLLPVQAWEKMVLKNRRCYSTDKAFLSYTDDPFGFPPLREALCEYLRRARGLVLSPERVILTSTSRTDQAARLLINVGDTVAIEDPWYPVSRRILMAYGPSLVTIPVDEQGMIVDKLTSRMDGCALVCVSPSHQDPTGAILSMDRREALLEWAGRSDTLIWEHDFDSQYFYDNKRLPALQGLDKNDLVIYSGSFWVTMGPMARLGYLVVPERMTRVFGEMIQVLGNDLSMLEQYCLNDFIREGHWERHIEKMRNVYAHRRQKLIYSLKTMLHEMIHVAESSAGLHLTFRLKTTLSDREVLTLAAQCNISLISTAPYYLSKDRSGEFLWPYWALEEEQIEPAVAKLAALLGQRSN
ncbi:MAG: PLP-dependent aminotransferase family protein [Cyanobacteria bacterium SZAS LIN-2]|nr:PLP-dependent aminotransferase family protein [Cyanobacteria bacterium SZAS LIN-2]